MITSCSSNKIPQKTGYTNVDISNSVIKTHKCSNEKCRSAELELKYHLELITNKKIEVSKGNSIESKFEFIIEHPSLTNQVQNETKSIWIINPKKIEFSGSNIEGPLFAVYEFLQQIGVRWIFPGNEGTFYENQSIVRVKHGTYQKSTNLKSRSIRLGLAGVPKMQEKINSYDLKISNKSNYKEIKQDVQLWRKRMQMGGSIQVKYGHAFTDWWGRYNKSNPDFFALNKYGERGPEISESLSKLDENALNNTITKNAHKVKMCVSNKNLQNQIIKNWKSDGQKSNYVNVCENDGPGIGFCRCNNCQNLDQKAKEEPFGKHLTDRYVFLTNEIAKKARKLNPDAIAVMYAYNETEFPPRKYKLEPNVLVVIVPTSLDVDKVRELFEGWKKMGAKNFAFRPNYHHYFMTGSLPLGIEKRMFDVAKLAMSYYLEKIDYDCLMHNWSINGFSDYVLSRSFTKTDITFQEIEEEYFQAFGNAAEPLKSYFHYWRSNLWQNKLASNVSKIQRQGKYHNFMRGLMWDLKKYYSEDDFKNSKIFLESASRKELTNNQQNYVNDLILAHDHAFLLFSGITSKREKRKEKLDKLHKFRKENQGKMNIDLPKSMSYELYWGDVTNLKEVGSREKYSSLLLETPLFWKFKIDRNNVGLKQHWEKNHQGWEIIRIDNYWQKPHKALTYLSTKTVKELKNYRGAVWYSTKYKLTKDLQKQNLILHCPGIKGTGTLYINDKKVKEFSSDGAIDFNISKHLDFSLTQQTFTFRIEDHTSQSGIYEKIYVGSKKK